MPSAQLTNNFLCKNNFGATLKQQVKQMIDSKNILPSSNLTV